MRHVLLVALFFVVLCLVGSKLPPPSGKPVGVLYWIVLSVCLLAALSTAGLVVSEVPDWRWRLGGGLCSVAVAAGVLALSLWGRGQGHGVASDTEEGRRESFRKIGSRMWAGLVLGWALLLFPMGLGFAHQLRRTMGPLPPPPPSTVVPAWPARLAYCRMAGGMPCFKLVLSIPAIPGATEAEFSWSGVLDYAYTGGRHRVNCGFGGIKVQLPCEQEIVHTACTYPDPSRMRLKLEARLTTPDGRRIVSPIDLPIIPSAPPGP